ncbi:MAG: carotenoid 1,2-hydratase [Acidobacteria bacterium]|nr:carotenoid 1,2-hydratase [Acidobacteriota bacterium]
MRSSLAALAFTAILLGQVQWRPALPGFRHEFPKDHFGHPDFQNEWWYSTGNLHSTEGKRFGYELTFFRHGVTREAAPGSVWDVPDVWMAHLALSDISGRRFHHVERLNRPGPGFAGADAAKGLIWNGNWFSRLTGGGQAWQLQAIAADFSLRLGLEPAKEVVIHGADGVSQKGPSAGQASHYASFTRLRTKGVIELQGSRHNVEGLSWMDHEFFSHQLTGAQAGWDWFSIQFDDGSDLMLFRLRRNDGKSDSFSAGTWVPADGKSRPLTSSEFSLVPGAKWKSEATHAAYPVAWTIAVPPLQLQLRLKTPLKEQEFTGKSAASPSYWEGVIDVEGTREGRPVRGSGYLEMTGYAGKIVL